MASTYSTNLAIELIGTGDQAGAWGNTTNTNLGTLIEQAISGYVTQAVSTGATTTITIPNGSTGVARNMYIELTGTGGSNTFLEVPSNKKLYFIFNNSTGAVTVRVTGQTGVSVPAGKKMSLVSNGTDIVNATNYIENFSTNSATVTNVTLTSATVTNAIVTTLTATSANITTLTTSSANITTLTGNTFGSVATTQLRGASANITTLTGTTFGETSTTQLRGASGNITTLTGSNLTYTSLTLTNALTVANGGTGATSASAARTNLGLVIGTDIPSPTGTGASGTWGINISGNAATATSATSATTATTANQVANAVTFNNGGAGDASGTTFNGSAARTISYNTVGAPSTTGTNASGTWAISISGNAATATNGVVTTGSYANPAWITSLAASKLTGTVAVANGGTALSSTPTNGQLLIGNGSGYSLATLTAGSGISITNGAGSISIATAGGLTGTTSANLTALGVGAAASLTSGTNNTLIGYNSGTAVTTGFYNTFVGDSSGAATTSGAGNTIVGFESGSQNNNSFNTYVGVYAGRNINSNGNTAVGYFAGQGASGASGADNTSCGYQALRVVTTGYSNTAVGSGAADSVTTGYYNVVVGATAGNFLTTGYENTLVGYGAGDVIGVGVSNSFFGKWAGIDISSGSYNTGIGQLAMGTGFVNTTNSSALGYNAQVTGSDQVQLGNSLTTTYAYGAVQNRSDARDKTDIADTDLGLNFILALRPRKFRWDMREDYRAPRPPEDATQQEIDAWKQANSISALTHDGTHKRTRFHQGLIAQEVKQVMDTMGVDFGGYQDHTIKGGEDVKSIGYGELISPLIKAIQELKAEFDEYKRTHP